MLGCVNEWFSFVCGHRAVLCATTKFYDFFENLQTFRTLCCDFCNFQTQVASGTWTTNFLRLSSFNSNLPKWQRYSKQHDARCFKNVFVLFCSFCCIIVVIVIIVFVVAFVVFVTDIVVLVVVLYWLIIVVVVIVMIFVLVLILVLDLGVVIAALHLFQAT